MKISLIIPAYNEEKRIAKCLKSILAQEGLPQFEVLVINNASCDRTADIANAFGTPVRTIKEPRQGMTIARNRGANEATGELLAFLDADVILPPNWVNRIIQIFYSHPDLVGISGPYRFYDLPSKYKVIELANFRIIMPVVGELILNKLLHKGTLWSGGNITVRRDMFINVGGFDENIVFYGEDVDLARRISRLGSVSYSQDLWVWSSARRLLVGNPFLEGFRYIFNYSLFLLTGHSRSTTFRDIP
jgi:glycosyltransferase involved in cell wall biosynthesis